MGAPTALTQDPKTAKTPRSRGDGVGGGAAAGESGDGNGGGGRSSVPVWRLIVTIAACTAIESTLGIAYIRGNLMPYMTSYLRNVTGETTVDYSDMLWVENSGWMAFAASVSLCGMLQKRMHQRLYLFLGVCMHAASYFGSYWAIGESFIAVVIVNGVLLGLAQAVMYPACVGVALQWFPRHRGLVGGITMAGFGVGAFIWNQINTGWINPDNLQPDLAEGESLYFTQPDLLDKVPSCYLLLGGILGSIQLLGLAAITFPPRDASDPKAGGEVQQPDTADTNREEKGDLKHRPSRRAEKIEMKRLNQSETRCQIVTEDNRPGKDKRPKRTTAAETDSPQKAEAETSLPHPRETCANESETSRRENNKKCPERAETRGSSHAVSVAVERREDATAVGKPCSSPNEERQIQAETKRGTAAEEATQSRPEEEREGDQTKRDTVTEEAGKSGTEVKQEGRAEAKRDTTASDQSQTDNKREDRGAAARGAEEIEPEPQDKPKRPQQVDAQRGSVAVESGISLRHVEDSLQRVERKCEKVTMDRVRQHQDRRRGRTERKSGKDTQVLGGTEEKSGKSPNYSVLEVVTSRVTWLLWLNYLTVDYSFMFVVMFYKTYGQTFIHDDHLLSLVASFASVFNALSRPVWGLVADRIGFLPTMLLTEITLVVTSATLVASELTGSSAMFFAWVCAMFAAVGGVYAIQGSLISSLFGFKNFVFNFGIVTSTGMVSCLTAIPLARMLLNSFGWKGLFFTASGILSVGVLALLSTLVTCGRYRCIPRHVLTRMLAAPRRKHKQTIIVKL